MSYSYAAQNVDPEITSKAAGREIPVKPKFAVNVCKAIKGKTVKQARRFLEDVIVLKAAVPFTVHKRQVKHRKGGIGPGQYPVNASKAILRVLNDAASNAEYKGLDPENMWVWHACTHRGAPIPGFMPRAQGRATQWNKQTSHIEIVLKTESEAYAAKAEAAATAAAEPAADGDAPEVSKAKKAGERKRAAVAKKAAKAKPASKKSGGKKKEE